MRPPALALAAAALLSTLPTPAHAQQIHPLNMVSGVDSTSSITAYEKTFYTVPGGMTFVLTDMATEATSNRALLYDASGLRYVLQRATQVGSAGGNSLSLSTGLVFQSGASLILYMPDNPWTRFSWSGYLVPAVVGIAPAEESERRLGFALTPNPSGQVVELRFELGKPADVSLRIYDVAGRLIATLADARLPAGRHDLAWTGKNKSGEPVAAGVYFARLESSETNSVRRLVRVR